MSPLTSRDRRALQIGGSILLLAFLATRVIPAWVALVSRERAAAVEAMRAAADGGLLVASSAQLRDSLAKRKGQLLAAAPLLIGDPTPSGAATSLAAVVADAATRTGVVVGAITLEPDSSVSRLFAAPRVRAEARGDISGLVQFLLLLELGPPFVRITELSVSQGDPAGAPGRAEELRFTVTVEGIAIVPTAARRAGEVQ